MTQTEPGIRPGEEKTALPAGFDAGLYFIGRIHTPWPTRADCPHRGDAEAGPVCRIALDPRWQPALAGLEPGQRLQILYWLDESRRDLVTQRAHRTDGLRGTFALRSPVRPNPIASSDVVLLALDGPVLSVRGLDCRDGTPLLDIKPVFRDRPSA